MNDCDRVYHENSMIVGRPPLAWPDGHHVAFLMVVSAEYYELQPPEEAFIEVWRPGRPEGARRDRPRGQRRASRRPEERPPAAEAPPPGVAAASPVAAPAEAAKPAESGPRPPRPGRRPKSDRPPRERREPRDRGEYAAFAKNYSGPKDRRDKAPDPNSPFAKLAALKEQLEANAKERR